MFQVRRTVFFAVSYSWITPVKDPDDVLSMLILPIPPGVALE